MNRKIKGYGVKNEGGEMEVIQFTRPPLSDNDVEIELAYCGICHSDIHHAYNDWKDSIYPQIQGHEMTGIVKIVGKNVTKFKKGDRVAVGNLIESCRECHSCLDGKEQYCLNGGPSWVYNGHYRTRGQLLPTGELTLGGYSEMIRVNQDFVLHLPKILDMKSSTPLLCAGITVYNPLKQANVTHGMKVGVVGIGGLGHLAIKMAQAMGAEVVAITQTSWKINDSVRLGATHTIYSLDEHEMKSNQSTLDLIINTIPYPHDIDPYLNLLKVDGKLWILGVLEPFEKGFNGKLLTNMNRSICASNVGGIALTQEMLYFCAKHKIYADVEIVSINDVLKSFDRIRNSDVKYRFVIDLKTLKSI